MSYNCTISFKSINGKDIFSFMQNFKKYLMENTDKIAKENFSYCPFVQELSNAPNSLLDVSEILKEKSKHWVTDGIFKYRFFYDSDKGLLGVYGVPTCAQNQFDGTIYFQNSCDQNYDKKEYAGIIPFEHIFDKWYNQQEDDFIMMYEIHYKKPFDTSELDECRNNPKIYQERLDYIKKSIIYDVIWNPISETLFNDDKALYFSIYGGYDTQKIYSFLNKCLNEKKEWDKEFFADTKKEISVTDSEER